MSLDQCCVLRQDEVDRRFRFVVVVFVVGESRGRHNRISRIGWCAQMRHDSSNHELMHTGNLECLWSPFADHLSRRVLADGVTSAERGGHLELLPTIGCVCCSSVCNGLCPVPLSTVSLVSHVRSPIFSTSYNSNKHIIRKLLISESQQ